MTRFRAGHIESADPVTEESLAVEDLVHQNGNTPPTGDARFRALIEQIPVVTYTESRDAWGTIDYISPQVETILGFSPQEVVGQPGFIEARIHPDDRLPNWREAERTFRSGEPYRMEYRVRASDGRWVWLRDETLLIRGEDGAPLYRQGVLVDVTDLKAAEAELRESEARFRTVLASAPVGVVMQDASGEIILANAAAEAALGLAEEHLRGRTSFDPEWDAVHEDGSPFPGEEHPATVSLRTGKPCDDVVMGVLRPDGRRVWFSVNSRPLLRSGESTPYAVVVTFVDLTERFELEAALRQSEQRFRLLVQDGYDIITIVGDDGRRRYVSPSIARALGHTPSELEGGSAFDLVHPDDAPRLAAALAECAAGARRTGPFDLRFRHRDGSWRDFEVIATNFLDEPVISGIVFNSRDVTERKAAEAALRDNEARFRTIFEGAGVATALVDATGAIVLANPALGAFLGYDPAELVGMTVQALTHPEDDVAQQELRRRLRSRELDGYELEKRYLRRDGTVIWGHLHTVAIRDAEGDLVGALGQIQNITARKEAEAALRESEERFRVMFEGAAVATVLVDTAGKFAVANPAFGALLGYDPAELVGMTPQMITHPADNDPRNYVGQRVWAGEADAVQLEKRYLRRDGTVIWGLLTTVAIHDADGNVVGALGQVQDITARKAAEAALRESEARLQALVNHVPVALYRQELPGVRATTYVSPQWAALLGLSEGDVPIGLPALLDRMHPGDREIAVQAAAMAERDGVPFDVEYRLRHEDGHWIWIRDHSHVERDEVGNPVAWTGVLVDVTEHKRLTASLRESQERFRKAFEDAPIGMSIGSRDGICIDANPAYCRILGRTREEVVGHAFAEFTHPDDLEAYERNQARLKAGGVSSFQTEKRYVRPDGTVITGILTASLVRDEAGNVLYDIGQLQDITERKRLHAALREREAQLESIVARVPAAIYRYSSVPKSRFIFASAQFEALVGLSAGPKELAFSDYELRIHPDDLSAVMAADAVSEATGAPYDVKYRLRSQNGSWIWVHDRAAPDRNEHGVITDWYGVLLDISEEKRLEAVLQEREAQVAAIVEQLPAALYRYELEPTRRVTFGSSYFEALAGFPVGPTGLQIDDYLARVHPEDLSALLAEDQEAENTGRPFDIQYQLQSRDGSWTWVHDLAMPELDSSGRVVGWHGVLLDVTAQKRLESAARESEDRFRIAFERAPIGLALVEPDGTLRQVNQSLCDLLGYSEQELLDRGFQEITHPGDLEDDLELAARLWAGEIDTYQLEKRFLHKDGHVLWCQLTASVGRNAAGERYGIGQVQDITSRRELEVERAVMLASEREYARQLRALTEMRTDLLAMVAHELRTPIAAARIMVSMLATKELPLPEEARTFAAIYGQLDQLDLLVTDFANVAAAERDKFSVQLNAVPLGVLMGGAAAYAETGLTEHPFMMHPAPAVHVWCDPERIGQVLQNLLGNAAKHTPPGTAVTLQARRDGDRVTIEVADTGPGIPAADVSLIFEKFGRSRETTDREVAGTGLGLYVSHAIVEAHGSELTVASTPGSGTVFRFALKVVS